MKQLLFFLIVIFVAHNPSKAQPSNSPFEGTTWNVIRERLFNGENAQAYRFEDDIRFQLVGAETHQDSAIVTQLIDELNELFETVQIKMVDTEPNFKLTITQEAGGQSVNSIQLTSGYSIISVNLELGISGALSDKESVKQIYYHTIRQFTKLSAPQSGSSVYGGIFDSPAASDAEFKEIDKDLLKKLYSPDFHKNLKESTVRKHGHQQYLDLRYHNLIKYLSYSFKAILILFGFLFFLSKEPKRKQNPGLLLYIKQRTIILLILPFIYSFITTTGDLSSLLIASPASFAINFLATTIYAVLVLIIIYYSEPFFLKKINSFAGKQAFIFLSTNFAAFIVPSLTIFPFFMLSGKLMYSGFNPVSFWSQGSQTFTIVFVAALRVFYNFIQYRTQSMVNEKDVELAKMKELKNQAELNALHSRINPHFLYNSLNSIASLAHTDADKTENMATGLSDLFRYSINKENKTYVSVAEELEMVKKYLEIEKTRFGDRLTYEINAEESAMEKQIPKFLIQPLVENAVKHGLSKMKGTGKIRVEVKQLEKDMSISIFDNGPDFPDEPVSGYGLQNLHDKLDIIYGKQALINWENGAHKNFTIMLKNQFEL
ncbi:histidine kinase [uncultured Draconibacterium sp.]|uniref:sensor histidine kinase n=1 Tax=uncultured Draconibacterium sp. TaxID=1573823 RepID=UPI0029C602A1|nr:histidine kinase [uncultured Draconibacterium sp.]